MRAVINQYQGKVLIQVHELFGDVIWLTGERFDTKEEAITWVQELGKKLDCVPYIEER